MPSNSRLRSVGARIHYFTQYLTYLVRLALWHLRHRGSAPIKYNSYKGYSFYNRYKKSKRLLFLAALFFIPSLLILVILRSRTPSQARADWYNDNWAYRKTITVTNNTTTETNVYIAITSYDASDTTKYQADCGDIRFTNQAGQILPYYVSSCGASTTFHVQLDSFPAGAQTIYLYYGNPSVENGFSASDFSTVASNYTINSTGSETQAPSPIAYWKFDEGADNTCSDGSDACDSTTNNINGTFGTSTAAPTWKPESECISGKCLYFDGTDDYITLSSEPSFTSGGAIAAWIKTSDTSARIVALDGALLGIANSTQMFLCADGAGCGTTVGADYVPDDNQWHHILMTWDNSNLSYYLDGNYVTTVADSGATDHGRGSYVGAGDGGAGLQDYVSGLIDDVRIYNYALSATQVKKLYNENSAIRFGP